MKQTAVGNRRNTHWEASQESKSVEPHGKKMVENWENHQKEDIKMVHPGVEPTLQLKSQPTMLVDSDTPDTEEIIKESPKNYFGKARGASGSAACW